MDIFLIKKNKNLSVNNPLKSNLLRTFETKTITPFYKLEIVKRLASVTFVILTPLIIRGYCIIELG